jgi:hypothetical protein
MSEIATYPTADHINEHALSTFSANDTIALLETCKRHHMHQFYKRAPLPMTSTLTTAPKPPEQTKLLSRHSYWAGMALRAEYDGASYLLYFQELEVKTVFVRFFDPPDEETEGTVWAGSSRFSEAQPFYTECHDDENLSGYLVQDSPELVGQNGCILTFYPNGFNGLRDLNVIRSDFTRQYDVLCNR